MHVPETLAVFDTIETADCVESCPIEGYEASMIVATYQLNSHNIEAANTRTGTLQHYYLSQSDTMAIKAEKMKQIDIEDGGVFDIKWSNFSVYDKPVLALATANGSIRLASLSGIDGNHPPELDIMQTVVIDAFSESGLFSELQFKEAESVMCLSLDWNNRVLPLTNPRITSSYSNGKLAVWNVSSERVALEAKWTAHDLYGVPIEAWITAYDCHNPNISFSGADDAQLKGWDRRSLPRPTFVNKHQHAMGVCSIQVHPFIEHFAAVGSYDEYISFWDDRQMSTPIYSYHAGGGVWRLKWHPKHENLLLAACMHNGIQTLTVNRHSAPKLWNHYTEHKSLAYGVDWCLSSHISLHNTAVIGSCSFYDTSFHIWRQPLQLSEMSCPSESI